MLLLLICCLVGGWFRPSSLWIVSYLSSRSIVVGCKRADRLQHHVPTHKLHKSHLIPWYILLVERGYKHYVQIINLSESKTKPSLKTKGSGKKPNSNTISCENKRANWSAPSNPPVRQADRVATENRDSPCVISWRRWLPPKERRNTTRMRARRGAQPPQPLSPVAPFFSSSSLPQRVVSPSVD